MFGWNSGLSSLNWFRLMFQCFGCLFQMTFPDDCFGLLFQMTISENAYFRCLFQMAAPYDNFGWLFRITVPDDYFEWLFRMPISEHFSRWLFRMTISHYCSRRLFRMPVSDDFSGWLFVIPRPFCNSATDPYFDEQLVFPRPIPISTNYSTDWSDDWFVLERRLPTAELWPRSPPLPLSGFGTRMITAKKYLNPRKKVFLLNLRLWPAQKPKIWSFFYGKKLI